MRVLITGATGFVSSYFLRYDSEDHEIFALGRSLPDGVGSNVKLIPCDLADASDLDQLRTGGGLPDKIDCVVHMAVSRRHRDFPSGAMDLFGVNCFALQQLLQYAVDVGAKSFVLGSTCSVYDGMPTDKEISEVEVPNPTRYWPATKYAADMIAMMYQNLFPVSVLRFATPYGPSQYDRLIPELFRRVTNDIPVLLPPEGDGIIMRPIFVSDAAQVLKAAIGDAWSGIYNVAGSDVYSLRAIAAMIGEITNRDVVFERSPNSAAYAIVPGVEKLESKFEKFENFVPLREGLEAIFKEDISA